MPVLSYFQRKKAKQQQAIATIDEAIPLLAGGDDVDEEAVEAAQLAAQLSDEELEARVALCRRRSQLTADVERARIADEKATALDQEIASLDATETARRKKFAEDLEPLQLRRNELRQQATTDATRQLFDTADPRVKSRSAELRARRTELEKGLAYAQGEVIRCEADENRAAESVEFWRRRDNGADSFAAATEQLQAHRQRLALLKASVKDRDAEISALSDAVRRLESLQLEVWVTPDEIEAAAAV